MQLSSVSTAHHHVAMFLLLITSLLGCVPFAPTPALFPNPVDVTIDELPQPLQEQIQRRHPDDQIRKIQYSAETQQYGVTNSSGTILLYDVNGREMGAVL